MRTQLPGPRLSGKLVSRVRLEMSGRGFALVDTPRFFDGGLLGKLKKGRTVIPFHSDRWRQFPLLGRYGRWLEALLARALPEESLVLVALEFRHEPAGKADPEVDRLHADGSYVRSVCTLYGRPTHYRDGAEELPVPDGQTLLMTAMGRARAVGISCTLHRRPGSGPERGVIVCSLEPRPRSTAHGRSRRGKDRGDRHALKTDWDETNP